MYDMGLMIQLYEIYICGIYIYIYIYILLYICIYAPICIYCIYIYIFIYIFIYIYIYIYIYIIYIKTKTEQFCISFEICSLILDLFLLTYEHIYNVTYNRYVQLTISSVMRVYYRVV